MGSMEKWLSWAIEIQSLAQAGLAYTANVYDIERYERLREIAAEMLAEKTGETAVQTETITKITARRRFIVFFIF